MARKRFSEAEIFRILREIEVHIGEGLSSPEALRKAGISEPTYYRWRKDYGGLEMDQVKRLKVLEQENARLKKAIADLTLDKLILKEGLDFLERRKA